MVDQKEGASLKRDSEKRFKCRYCGKDTPVSEKYVGTIYARQYPGGKKAFDYCSMKCRGHDQMGHEG
jgi:hypothetical protein